MPDSLMQRAQRSVEAAQESARSSGSHGRAAPSRSSPLRTSPVQHDADSQGRGQQQLRRTASRPRSVRFSDEVAAGSGGGGGVPHDEFPRRDRGMSGDTGDWSDDDGGSGSDAEGDERAQRLDEEQAALLDKQRRYREWSQKQMAEARQRQGR